jgi:hypothetical protein
MRAHVIADGVVVNTIEVDSLDAMPSLIEANVGAIGWVWDGENLTPPAPDTETQWAVIRTERNKLLADCDWTQVADAPVDAAAWATYRQELRDITTQADPFAIVWPESPSS